MRSMKVSDGKVYSGIKQTKKTERERKKVRETRKEEFHT